MLWGPSQGTQAWHAKAFAKDRTTAPKIKDIAEDNNYRNYGARYNQTSQC